MPASKRAMSGSPSPMSSGSPPPRITLVALRTVSNSLRGMPIMSQMTSSGNGCDMASTRSTSPCSQKPSMTSVQMVSTESRTPWSWRGVKDRATMPRWRAWRGSSMLMNEPKNSSASAGMSGIDTAPLPGAEVQRAPADLDDLGVAGGGVEVLGLPAHRVVERGRGEGAGLADVDQLRHPRRQRLAPELRLDQSCSGRHRSPRRRRVGPSGDARPGAGVIVGPPSEVSRRPPVAAAEHRYGRHTVARRPGPTTIDPQETTT